MPRAARLAAVLLLALPALVTAAPQSGAPRLDPKTVSALPSHIQHVAPAVVGIHVEVPSDRPSAATLGAERWGSGVLFDAAGYALTVSYVLIDAARVEVVLRDGRKVEAQAWPVSISKSGLGVIKLEGPGPWPAASLGDSTRLAVGDITGTVGMDEDGALIATPGTVKSIRAFAASWEYMLDRALFVAPVQFRVRRGGPRGSDRRRDGHHLAAARGGDVHEPGHSHRAVPRGRGRADRQGPRGEPAAAAVARTLHARNRRRGSWWRACRPSGRRVRRAFAPGTGSSG